jgi:hypothetical protein
MKERIESAIKELGYRVGISTSDPAVPWPHAEGMVTCVVPEYSFGDGISAVVVAPSYVQKWFLPYPWGHSDWRSVGQRIAYTSMDKLAAALKATAKLDKGMWE